MAFELGSILARLKMDTSDYEKGAQRAESSTRGLGGILERGVGASTAFATGLLAVGAALTAAAGFAVKSAAGIEQTRTAFTTMLKDGDKAGQLMRELNKFAAETPFEFPELADAGKKLLAFGFAANEIQPNLRRLGDVASGLGIPIGELSELYGKARVQGRLYMEDVNQLTGRGIPIIQEFAKQFGVSEGEVRNLVEQGKIGFPELQKGIENMTNAGGQFAGGMAAQSQTVNGLISTLMDNIGAFARELVGMSNDGSIAEGSIFAKVKDGLVILIDFLNNNKDAIKNGIKDALDFIQQYAPIIAGVIIAMLVPAFLALAGAAVSFITAMAPFIAIGAAIGAAFMLLQPYFGVIGDYINTTLIPIFQGFMGWLNQLWQAVLPALLAAWAFLQPAFQQLGDVIINQLWPALQQLWQMLVDVWNQVAPVLLPALQILGTILGVVITAAVWLVVTALSFVIGVISDVIKWVASMGAFFAGVINAIIVIVTAVGVVIGAIFINAFAIVAGVITFFGNLFRMIFNTIMAIAAFVLNTIGSYWSMLIGVVQTVLGTIANVVSNLMHGNVKGAFQAALDGIKNIWNGIVGFFKGIIDGVVATVGRVKDGIVAPFRDAVNTIKGLMDGAKSALSNLNPFQRHSPSLVDWVTRGTKVIAGKYDDMTNSIAAGTLKARVETIGTSRSLVNVSPAQVSAAAEMQGGANGASLTINVEGVLADSPEAKRKFRHELVTLINDARNAAGAQPI